MRLRRLVPLALAAALAARSGVTQESVDGDRAGREREAAIEGLLREFAEAQGPQAQIRTARALGRLRASEGASPLVDALVRLHRAEPSPLRNPESQGHGLAEVYVDALRRIGRPGLERFLEALASWEGYALDLTWAFVEVHGEEGILVLRHRARSEPDPERRARLEAAAWFTRLRAPELGSEGMPGGEPETFQ